MADIVLKQAEADALIALEKFCVDDRRWAFPIQGERIAIPLLSADKRENFILDISRGRIKLTQATIQNRARHSIVLMRLDIDGPLHRNPDGEEILCPHLHTYREGYGTKWAQPVRNEFGNTTDIFGSCIAFMDKCNIVDPPQLEAGLF